VPNTFAGIAFAADGERFCVAGGKDDNLHLFVKSASGDWKEEGSPITLGHTTGGLGLVPGKKEPLASAGRCSNGRWEIAASPICTTTR